MEKSHEAQTGPESDITDKKGLICSSRDPFPSLFLLLTAFHCSDCSFIFIYLCFEIAPWLLGNDSGLSSSSSSSTTPDHFFKLFSRTPALTTQYSPGPALGPLLHTCSLCDLVLL